MFKFDSTISSRKMGLMMGIIRGIFKIIHYVILNSIVGLIMSLFAYVLIGNVKFSILLFLMFFVGGLFVE